MYPTDTPLSHCPVRERIFARSHQALEEGLVTMATLFLCEIVVGKPTMKEVLVPDYPIPDVNCGVFGASPRYAQEASLELLESGILPKLELDACAHVVANIHSQSSRLMSSAPYWIQKWNTQWCDFGDSSDLSADIRIKIEKVMGEIAKDVEVFDVQWTNRQLAEIDWIWNREIQWLSIKGILLLCCKTVQEAITRCPSPANDKMERLIGRVKSFVYGASSELEIEFPNDKFDSCIMAYPISSTKTANAQDFSSKGLVRMVVGDFVACLDRLLRSYQADNQNEKSIQLQTFRRRATGVATQSTISNFIEVRKVDSSRFPDVGSSFRK